MEKVVNQDYIAVIQQDGDKLVYSELPTQYDLQFVEYLQGAVQDDAISFDDIQKSVFVLCVYTFNCNIAFFRHNNGVEKFGKCGFAAAVGTQHSHKLTFFNLQIYTLQRPVILAGVSEPDVFCG